MNTRGIEVLLEKFFEGNTNLQEEKILLEFFRRNDVPFHLLSHQSLFAYYIEAQQQELNAQDFEQKLSGQFTDKLNEMDVIKVHPARRIFLYVTGIAACILILIGLFITFQNDIFKTTLMQAGNPDPEIAYAEASKALILISGNLNNGLKEMDHLQIISKALKDMEVFNKFYQYQTIIINPDDILKQSIKSN